MELDAVDAELPPDRDAGATVSTRPSSSSCPFMDWTCKVIEFSFEIVIPVLQSEL